MKKIGYAGLSTVLCLASALPVLAQTPAEVACNGKYGKYYSAQTNFALGNEFLDDATCKDNMYREGTFQIMIQKMVETSKFKEAIDLANRFGKDMPGAKNESKVYVYSQALTAAGQLGDVDKILEMGEKVLSVDANNLNAMVIVATTIPEKVPTEAAAKEKALDRAMELAKKLLAMARPGGIDDKTWQTAVQGPAHSVVGFVHLQKAANADAAAEYDQAVKINPKDQMSWYRYALATTYIATASQKLIQPAYDEVNNNRTPGPERDAAVAKRDAIEADYTAKREKAIEVFIPAVALGGPIADSARKTLDSLWEPAHNGSKDGLDEAIAKKKAELGVK